MDDGLAEMAERDLGRWKPCSGIWLFVGGVCVIGACGIVGLFMQPGHAWGPRVFGGVMAGVILLFGLWLWFGALCRTKITASPGWFRVRRTIGPIRYESEYQDIARVCLKRKYGVKSGAAYDVLAVQISARLRLTTITSHACFELPEVCSWIAGQMGVAFVDARPPAGASE